MEKTLPTTPRPRLEHFIGQAVQQVNSNVRSSRDPATWSIVFEGGAVLKNQSKNISAPPVGIEGLQLMTVTFSESETRLFLGSPLSGAGHEISISPTEYTLVDPARPEWGEVRPQMPEELEVVLATVPPDDPSPERAQEGPSEDWHRGQTRPATDDALEASESDGEGTESSEGGSEQGGESEGSEGE